jgi:hypothetical protein
MLEFTKTPMDKLGFLFFITVLLAPMIAMSLPYGMPAFAIFGLGTLIIIPFYTFITSRVGHK